MRVLVANEPRSYRDVIAAALQSMRSSADVAIVEPERLDAEVTRRKPHLVLCSRLTAAAGWSFDWVVLHPDGENRAEINVRGERRIVSDLDLDGLLAVFDAIAAPLVRDSR